MQTARIEKWAIVEDYGRWCLCGEVYDHPKIEDGHRVLSSVIIEMDRSTHTVQTENTTYHLGKPILQDFIDYKEFSNRQRSSSVIDEIIDERSRQDKKWGIQNHEPFIFLSILGEEVGEAHNAALKAHNWETETWDIDKIADLRIELVQIAAVAVAMTECIDRGEFYNKLAS